MAFYISARPHSESSWNSILVFLQLIIGVNVITAESVQWLIRSNQKHLQKIWISKIYSYLGKNKISLNEILKFVLEGRKIAHLSVCKSMIIED